MNIDPYGEPGFGLGWYVRSVAEELGLPAEAASYELDEPATAYVALDERCPAFPDLDLMLLWDEENGWAVAVETHPADPAVVLAYAADAVVPPPTAVRQFVSAVTAGRAAGQTLPPAFRTAREADGLDELLAAYALAHQHEMRFDSSWTGASGSSSQLVPVAGV
ncbi:hypothetical protein GCM10012275_58880 [Longimycelium tulufanense]|uniref:DUF6292 domain-containing protein n=1 Tax=Longimycelium tulufanense TaxID=907463 RepID=A0A8J3FYA4_9PSEU|nr:DUF6292 family protein [Longimycelium tulufanense]GGM80450.1 hypothetical protein GCM10012275_58880 [Longimycelium tulufanense]